MHGAPDPDEYFDHVLFESRAGGGRVAGGPAAEWRRWWRVTARDLVHVRPELALACRQGFVLRTDQLRTVEISRKRARTLVAKGTWSIPARGTVAVVDPSGPRTDPPADRWTVARRTHALGCAAAALKNPGLLIDGVSAAVLRGLPTIEVPAAPQLTAPLELGTHRQGKAGIASDEVTSWYGVPVLSVARTIVDIARRDRREGLVVADAALHEQLVGKDDLARALERSTRWCGVRTAREIVAFADGAAESPLESLTRLALHDDGFPALELQFEIEVPGRWDPYRVDLYWPDHRVVLECDGRVKYREEAGDVRSAVRDAGWREKRRETALRRAAGVRVERVVWDDVVHDWPQTAAYLRTVLGLDAVR